MEDGLVELDPGWGLLQSMGTRLVLKTIEFAGEYREELYNDDNSLSLEESSGETEPVVDAWDTIKTGDLLKNAFKLELS